MRPIESSPHSPSPISSSCEEASERDSWLECEYEKIFARDPSKQHEFNFYMEYCRLMLTNAQLVQQVTQIAMQVESARQDKRKLQRQLLTASNKRLSADRDPLNESNSELKRNRRLAGDITRHFACSFKNCQKSYGSEGSLHQHMRLKHATIP